MYTTQMIIMNITKVLFIDDNVFTTGMLTCMILEQINEYFHLKNKLGR